MRTFKKFIQVLVTGFVLALVIVPTAGATIDTNQHTGAFAKELIDIVRLQQYYPQSAVSVGVEGELTIHLKIDKEGNIIEKKVVQHSGSRILDYAALRMLNKIQSFPKIPTELGLDEFEFEVPMNFILEQ